MQAPASLTQAVRTHFLRKPPGEMLHLLGPGRMTLVSVETAGLDPGTTASSLHPGPAPLAQFAAGEHRTRESGSGGKGPSLSPACSSPIFPRDQRGHLVPPHPCCAWGVSLHRPPRDGRGCAGPRPPPLLPSHLGGRIQPSHRASHGTAWHLQAIMPPGKPFAQAPRLHPPAALPQALLNITQTWGRWDTVTSHTGSSHERSQTPPLARQVPTGCQAPTHPRLIPAPLTGSSAR